MACGPISGAQPPFSRPYSKSAANLSPPRIQADALRRRRPRNVDRDDARKRSAVSRRLGGCRAACRIRPRAAGSPSHQGANQLACRAREPAGRVHQRRRADTLGRSRRSQHHRLRISLPAFGSRLVDARLDTSFRLQRVYHGARSSILRDRRFRQNRSARSQRPRFRRCLQRDLRVAKLSLRSPRPAHFLRFVQLLQFLKFVRSALVVAIRSCTDARHHSPANRCRPHLIRHRHRRPGQPSPHPTPRPARRLP